jgi:PAS domain S-box-containing protein
MRLIESRKQLVLGVVLIVGAILANIWLGVGQTRQLHRHANWVAHTYAVLSTLDRCTGSLADAEASQRGYIITGDERFLDRYGAARQAAVQSLAELSRATADNSEQQAEIPQMRNLIEKRLAVLDANREMRRTQGFEPTRDAVADGGGRELIDEIRSIAGRMEQRERLLLDSRTTSTEDAYRSSLLNTVIGSLLALLAVGAFLSLLNRYLQIVKGTTAVIRKQREVLRATLISIGDGVITADRGGRVTLLNRVAESLTGWTEADALGRPLREIFQIINEETREAVDNPAIRALRDGRITELANHTILIARNGAECPIDDVAAPICSPAGEISGVILVFREIRERRLQEKELRLHAEALREADRRKDEFLATLAHELRNPLSPLSNALQLWPLVEDNREQMEQLRQMMERQIHQMKRVIDDLLDVSRITRGKIELRLQQVDLQTLIHGAVETVQGLITSSSQRLTIDAPDEPIVIDGDVARLTQIFGNILHNAVKYSGHGGAIQIVVRVLATEVQVSFIDDGPGIPPEMLTRIFEIFQQVDQTLERSHGGLGIGLTLVKRLTELHGGHVEAFSGGMGKGSRFVVTLPLRGPQTITQFQHDPELLLPGQESRRLPMLRVLVVDDVLASAKTLVLMLQSIGQNATMLHDGTAAVEWTATHRPDVVFLDIAMPGMSGYEVARRIRAADDQEATFLVALTGYGQEEDRRRAIEAGFNYHLTKPTTIEALEQLLMTRPRRPSAASKV